MSSLPLKPLVPVVVASKLMNPQVYLTEEFARVGLTAGRAGEMLLEVAQQIEDQGARVKAIELFLSATYGMAPTQSRALNLNATVKQDRFFDEAVFKNPPPLLGAPQAKKLKKGKG